jgi:DNA invertase Pin-like site-specific DNA recombinase
MTFKMAQAYVLPPLAVSLVRFSTKKQADDDSYRRQLAPAQDFCDKKGWELDLSLHEKDVRRLAASAFRGDQIRKGPLGKFITLVESGSLPKDRQIILLVEEIDRLTRQVHDEAYDLCLRLMRSGVWLCTIMDDEIYDLTSINESLEKRLKLQLKLDAARDHSVKLSNRLSAVWENRRTRILAGEKIVTDATPDWLKAENRNLVLPASHKQTIVRINRECRNGLGVRAITKLFNTDPGVPTFSGKKYWSASTIQKILENRETFGEVTFYRVDKDSMPGKVKRIPVLTIPDYYPAAITETDFILAKEARGRRKGIGPIQKQGRYSTMLSGMGKCWCGATLQFSNKAQSRRYLFCGSAARNQGCDNHRHYGHDQIEYELMRLLLLFDVSRITDCQNEHAAEVEAIQAQMREKDARAKWLTDSGEMTRRTREAIDNLDREIGGMQNRLDAIRESLIVARTRGDAHREFVNLVEQMQQAEQDDDNRKALRARISQGLRRIIHTIIAEGEDLIINLHPNRQWQLGFRLAASAPHVRGRKAHYRISSVRVQSGGEVQDLFLSLDKLAGQLGSMECYIDGTALTEFERICRDRLEAIVAEMGYQGCRTRSPDRRSLASEPGEGCVPV